MTEASADPLVERDRELAIIEAALDRARTGAAGVLLVEGVAGLGKSRLLREAAALAYRTGCADCADAVPRPSASSRSASACSSSSPSSTPAARFRSALGS